MAAVPAAALGRFEEFGALSDGFGAGADVAHRGNGTPASPRCVAAKCPG